MIEHGVALMRLSTNPAGCGGPLEEFYVVIHKGRILQPRFVSYTAAFKHCESLWPELRVDVA